jgi:hypothetical protein
VHRLLSRVPGGLARERHLGVVNELEVELGAAGPSPDAPRASRDARPWMAPAA